MYKSIISYSRAQFLYLSAQLFEHIEPIQEWGQTSYKRKNLGDYGYKDICIYLNL